MTPAVRTSDAILPGVLPADATSFVATGAVAETLVDAGASVVPEGTGGVGVAPWPLAGARNEVFVALLDAPDDSLDARSHGRAIVRAKDHARLRARVVGATALLRSRGYRSVQTVMWDRGQVARVPWAVAPPGLRPAERMPRRAAVIGVRAGSTAGPSILEQAHRDAGMGGRLTWPLARSGTLVTLTDTVVHRCAVGPARARLARAEAALEALEGTVPSTILPVVLGSGSIGAGVWTVERRVSGTPVEAGALDRAQRRSLVDVLSMLFSVASEPAASIFDVAAVLAELLGGSRAELVLAAANAVEPALRDLPGGMAHGDFWHGNVFFSGDAVSGVIDWDSAGPARLPAIDLLHFTVAGRVPRGSQQWGREVVAELEEDGTGDELKSYASAIGIDIDETTRRALVVAYWMDRLAYQASTYADRIHRPVWLEQNVDRVLSAVRAAVS